MKVADSLSMADSILSSEELTSTLETSAAQVTAEESARSDLWVFREGRREFSGPAFLRELKQRIAAKNSLVDSLIQGGELEAALADLTAPGATASAALTDSLACQLCGTETNVADPHRLAELIDVPHTIAVSPPEGFTYYALHPLDFARTADQLSHQSRNYAVVGIRSIGTTLGAVTAARLNSLGKRACRVSVRPIGHPYARNMEFSQQEQIWVAQQLALSAHFLIVDEGPGRSGSTFLSVAEALCRAGVTSEQITILGSRPFDPNSLCAQSAAERWRPFRFASAASSLSRRFESWTYLGGGDWRKQFLNGDRWPESWTQMERFKVLSPDRSEFVKFEGMGRIGQETRDRAFTLANAGFSPLASDIGDGFLAYKTVPGTPLKIQQLNTEILESIARYCAFRQSEFACTDSSSSELGHMLTYNVQEEFGRDLKLMPGQLSASRPVLVDGRMQSYEWVRNTKGQILKTDSISHGDNHFFPGPCDITWDLAGTIIEWELGPDAIDFFLGKFREFSGTNALTNLDAYLLAYSVFRLGFCKMARSTVRGTDEELRLDLAYRHYRAKATRLLGHSR